MGFDHEKSAEGDSILPKKEDDIYCAIKDFYDTFDPDGHDLEEDPAVMVDRFIKALRDHLAGIHEIEDDLAVLERLNPVVIKKTMDTTYAKIEKDGVPWFFSCFEAGKQHIIGYINSLVQEQVQAHANSCLIEQVSAERTFLARLREIGDDRLSDTSGVKYLSFTEQIYNDNGHNFDKTLWMQFESASFLVLKLLNQMITYWSGNALREKYDKLTEEYEEIRTKADRWLQGIYAKALPFPAAHHSN